MPATQIRHSHRMSLVVATILARMTIWVLGGYAVAQGIGILVGGAGRWHGPTYRVLVQAPGGHAFWAVGIIIFGMVTLSGSLARSWWLKAVGLAGIAGWSICFSFGVLTAILGSPEGGTTGVAVYFKDALVAIILILVDEDRRKR